MEGVLRVFVISVISYTNSLKMYRVVEFICCICNMSNVNIEHCSLGIMKFTVYPKKSKTKN